MLSLDAGHLKGEWNGTILTLTGKDSNNRIVNVSIAVCDKESADNYTFLLQKSKENASFAANMNDAGTTFFTGCHKSFISPRSLEVPLAQCHLCLQQILKNVEGQVDSCIC